MDDYALYLFREVWLNYEGRIRALLAGDNGRERLIADFVELGEELSGAAAETGVATVVYRLNGLNGLEDRCLGESLGLGRFCRDDGTFDLSSAVAAMELVRFGPRDPAAVEKEAAYHDRVGAEKASGEWGRYRRGFEVLAVMAVLLRLGSWEFEDKAGELATRLLEVVLVYDEERVTVYF